FLLQMTDVGLVKAFEYIGRAGETMVRRHLRHDPRIGSAGHRNRRHPMLQTEDVLEGARHRSAAGAAGQDQRSIDVKENEFFHDQNLNLLPRASATRPLAASSMRVFAATALANS